MDQQYYLLRTLEARTHAQRARSEYSSLEFDRSGAVNFACQEFRRSSQRWDGYRIITAPPLVSPEHLEALLAMARLSRERGAPFLLAVTPLRGIAETTMFPQELDGMWSKLRDLSSVAGVLFDNARAVPGYDDSTFVDFAHLNACGASRWTGELLDRHRSLLEKHLSMP